MRAFIYVLESMKQLHELCGQSKDLNLHHKGRQRLPIETTSLNKSFGQQLISRILFRS
ncbi:hypothetical protein YC2023_115828 [Brassica napus]